MNNRITLLLGILALMGVAFGVGSVTTRATNAQTMNGTSHQMMTPGHMGNGGNMMATAGHMGNGGNMMMHGNMQQMSAMDSQLTELVDKMNAASGNDKVEAMAAVLTELVSHRQTMHAMMMNPMTADMNGGCSGQGHAMMSDQCPMMKGGAATGSNDEQGASDHSEHHKSQ